MPPSSALSLPVSAAPARQLSRANRPRKRKSSAAEFLFCAPAAFTNMLHKTDGSYVNRLLFFLEEKRQKKINCGTAFSSALLRLSPTCYTKRTVHIRTVRFSFQAGRAGKRFFSERPLSPAVSFVSFLQEKKTYPFQEKKPSPIPFRRKETFPLSRSAPRRSAADRPRRNTRS